MALTFGGGITIGGGITLQPEGSGGGGGGPVTFNTGTAFSYAAPTFGGGVTVRDLRPAFVTALSGLPVGGTFIAVSGGQQYTFTVTTAFTFTNNGSGGFPNYDGYATSSPNLGPFSDITAITIG